VTTLGDRATWRLFVAVPVPEAVRATLAAALEPGRRRTGGARWQSPETWHLTVRFLGDTPFAALPEVEAAVRAAASGVRPFDLAIGEAGAFERGRGRIAWIGLRRGDEQLAALARALDGRLGPDPHRRGAFHAHLTIAREAPDGLAAALSGALRTAATIPGASLAWRADGLVLYRSVLGPGGATHSVVVEAPLDGRPVARPRSDG
jgi:2'-5' RNA ligase